MTDSPNKHQSWWRHFSEGDAEWLTLGHITFRRGREGDEFTLGVLRDLSADGARVDFDEPSEGLQDLEARRYVSAAAGAALTIKPRLLSRSVVVRPLVPLVVPPGEKLSIFVSTPVCAEVFVDDCRVDEFSIWDPRLTWFGPSPAVGELCFASHTRGTRSLAALSVPATRAATEVRLDNESDSAVSIEKLRLPVPRLSLGWSPETQTLATQRVSFRQRPDGLADVRIDAVEGHEPLAPPRESSPPAWRNALGALWS